MLEMTIRRGLSATALLSLLFTPLPLPRPRSIPVGYSAAYLASFSAAGLPAPGTGVVVAQNEAALNGGSPWEFAPGATDSYLSGITITYENSGSTAESYHADEVAGLLRESETTYFGNVKVYFPSAYGVTTVDLFNADLWTGTCPNTLNPPIHGVPVRSPRTVRPWPTSVGWITLKVRPLQ